MTRQQDREHLEVKDPRLRVKVSKVCQIIGGLRCVRWIGGLGEVDWWTKVCEVNW